MRKKHFILTTSLLALGAVNATDWVAGAASDLTQDRSTEATDTYAGGIESGYKTLRTNAVALVKGDLSNTLTKETYDLKVDGAEETISRDALLSAVDTVIIDGDLEATLDGHDFDPNHPDWKDAEKVKGFFAEKPTNLHTLLTLAQKPEEKAFVDEAKIKSVKVKEGDAFKANPLIETLYNLYKDKRLANQLKVTVNPKKLSENIDGPSAPRSRSFGPRTHVLDLFLDHGWGIFEDKDGNLKPNWPDLGDKETVKQLLGQVFFSPTSDEEPDILMLFARLWEKSPQGELTLTELNRNKKTNSITRSETKYKLKDRGERYQQLANLVAEAQKFVNDVKLSLQKTALEEPTIQELLEHDAATYKELTAKMVEMFLKTIGSSFDEFWQYYHDNFEQNLEAQLKRILPDIEKRESLTQNELNAIVSKIDTVNSFTLRFYQDIFEAVEDKWVKAPDNEASRKNQEIYSTHKVAIIDFPWIQNFTRLLYVDNKEQNNKLNEDFLTIFHDYIDFKGKKLREYNTYPFRSSKEGKEMSRHQGEIAERTKGAAPTYLIKHVTDISTLFFGDASEPSSLMSILAPYEEAMTQLGAHLNAKSDKIDELDKLYSELEAIVISAGSNQATVKQKLEKITVIKTLAAEVTTFEVSADNRKQINLPTLGDKDLSELPNFEQLFSSLDTAKTVDDYSRKLPKGKFDEVLKSLDDIIESIKIIQQYMQEQNLTRKTQRALGRFYGEVIFKTPAELEELKTKFNQFKKILNALKPKGSLSNFNLYSGTYLVVENVKKLIQHEKAGEAFPKYPDPAPDALQENENFKKLYEFVKNVAGNNHKFLLEISAPTYPALELEMVATEERWQKFQNFLDLDTKRPHYPSDYLFQVGNPPDIFNGKGNFNFHNLDWQKGDDKSKLAELLVHRFFQEVYDNLEFKNENVTINKTHERHLVKKAYIINKLATIYGLFDRSFEIFQRNKRLAVKLRPIMLSKNDWINGLFGNKPYNLSEDQTQARNSKIAKALSEQEYGVFILSDDD